MLWLWIVYALVVIGVLAWGSFIGMRFMNTLKDERLPERLPVVSLVVPARNEERGIDRCVRGLRGQEYRQMELIFVDDDSVDGTPDILTRHAQEDPRVKILKTGGKPDGWNGKQWACHCGAEASSGEWLCFMDADTMAEPNLISKTLAFCSARQIDMLSLQPWYEMRGLWERIVLPAGLPPLLLVFPPHRVNDPDDHLSIANGQFIMIRRDVYERIDGHAGVKDRMMDDYSLAEAVKKAGFRLFVADGTRVMRVRLYTNLKEIWEGNLKAAVQISGGWLASALGVIGNLVINVLPVVALLWALFVHNSPVAAIMGVTVLLQLTTYSILRMTAFRLPPWSGITYPIGGIIVAAMLLDGMVRLATGRNITWKGRPLLGRPELPVKRSTSSDLEGT
jgi:chlorobactene glucosyltransferase